MTRPPPRPNSGPLEVPADLIRLSVGIGACENLIEDLRDALE